MKLFLKFIGVCGIVTGLFALFIYLCFTLKVGQFFSSIPLDWASFGLACFIYLMMKILAKDSVVLSLIFDGLLYAVSGSIFGFDKVNALICGYLKYTIIGIAILISLFAIIGCLFGKKDSPEKKKEESIIDDDKSDDTHIPASTNIDKTAFKGCVSIKDSVKATI